jgi:hypothetical protein
MNATRTARPEEASRSHRVRDRSREDRNRGVGGEARTTEPRAQQQSERGRATQETPERRTTKDRQNGGRRPMGKINIPSNYKQFFTPDAEKIPEVILFLIEMARGRDIALTQYDILKAIWLADTSHLNRYGRLITFDNYVAMEYGPVGSLTYDALKPNFAYSRVFGEQVPWVSIYNGIANEFVSIKRAPRRDLLSESDQELLAWGLETVLTLGFGATKRLTHDHPAYQEAWKRRGSAAAIDMKPELLLDEPDDSYVADLKYISDHLP